MRAGVMLSGGTHQCYNSGARAMGQCKDCDPSYGCMRPGCSGAGGPHVRPCCNMCCPQNVRTLTIPLPPLPLLICASVHDDLNIVHDEKTASIYSDRLSD